MIFITIFLILLIQFYSILFICDAMLWFCELFYLYLFFPDLLWWFDGDGEDGVKKKKYNMLYLSAPPPPPLHSDMNIQLILEKTKMFFVSVIKNKDRKVFNLWW